MQRLKLKDSEISKLSVGRPNRYKWDEWLQNKGDQVTLTEGTDFTCQPRSLIMTAKHYARKVGIRLYCKILDKEVQITHIGKA